MYNYDVTVVCFRYGFGDCRKPLAESASLIEEIVHQQMTQLVRIK